MSTFILSLFAVILHFSTVNDAADGKYFTLFGSENSKFAHDSRDAPYCWLPNTILLIYSFVVQCILVALYCVFGFFIA